MVFSIEKSICLPIHLTTDHFIVHGNVELLDLENVHCIGSLFFMVITGKMAIQSTMIGVNAIPHFNTNYPFKQQSNRILLRK